MSSHTNSVALSLFTLSLTSINALEIRSYNSSIHDRYLNFPSNPSLNPNFLQAGVDLSGVGWHTAYSPRQVTMVSPIHFLGANHFKSGVGSSFRFRSTSGVLKTFQVGAQTTITNDSNDDSDLFIGTLTQAISTSAGINYRPYMNLANDAAYIAESTVLILGSNVPLPDNPRGTLVSISSIITPTAATTPSNINPTRALTINYSKFFGSNNDAYVFSGDSGSPVFIINNGTAAIVGTNSFVAETATNFLTHSNFVPYYVDKLNAVMEPDGYRMTKAILGSTTLSLTHTPPAATIRAGYSFNIGLNLDNTGSTMAENVKLVNTFPTGTSVTNASGTDWFDEPIPTATQARRAKINTGNDFDYTLTLSIPTPGSPTHSVTYRSDQSGPVTENFTLNVIESFLSWSAALTNASATGDDDLDGVSNLLEYAFGGDPETPSRRVSGETVNLLPEISQTSGVRSFTYVRRKDFALRALSYSLTSSTSLQTGSFTDASGMISNTQTTSINGDLELVTLTLTSTGTERFFRIEVELNES